MGRLPSIEAIDVPGCVSLETDRLNCIVSVDKGFGQIRHQARHMEQRDGRWEILHPEQGTQQEHAPRGITGDELRRAATGFPARLATVS